MTYTVNIDDNIITFNKPDIETIKQYESKVVDGTIADEMKAEKYLIEQTYVSGNDDILDIDNNADLFIKLKDSSDYKPFDIYPSTIEKLEDDTFLITVQVEDITYKAKFQQLKKFSDFCDYMTVSQYCRIDSDKKLIYALFIEGDYEMKDFNQYPMVYYSYRHHLHNLIGLYIDEVKKK